MRRSCLILSLFLLAPLLQGSACSAAQIVYGVGGGILGTTIAAARTPSNEIEQVYYLGVFDPQEQIPPTIFRVTVRGQASSISGTKFGSGWVRSEFVDSLTTQVKFDKEGQVLMSAVSDENKLADIQEGRRLMLFGPEGFRPAPKDHRLVIVMGASPEKFFEAVDTFLGEASELVRSKDMSALKNDMATSLIEIRKDESRIGSLKKDTDAEFPR